jgi:hypothetical protein
MENVTRVSMKSVAGLALAGLLTSVGPTAAILPYVSATSNTNYMTVVKVECTGLKLSGLCNDDNLSS